MSAILARIPSSMTASVLTLRGVAKTFARGLARAARRTAALCEVDLDLAPGEIVALNGADGAGKTTLLQCASGLLRVDAGEVRWFGDAFPGGGIVPGVAFVPAVPVFYPFLTVRDVLAYRASRDGSPWELAGGLIERAARSGTYDLVVLGTSLRQGNAAFLGPRSTALIGSLRTPVLLIAQ